MSLIKTDEKIIIIGAGVAGLVLAQILRKRGLPYEIYERDDGTNWQGWSIALDKCLETLYPLLPKDIRDPIDASPNHRRGQHDSFWILNGETHDLIGVLGNGPSEHIIHANRAEFRRIFMLHADVQFGKTFERYEETKESVNVFFTDGMRTTGTVLVGANGASSKVREQLLGGFKATPSRYTVVQGSVTLKGDVLSKVLEHSTAGVLIADRDQKSNCLMMDYNDDSTAYFCWLVAYRVPEWEAQQLWIRTASADELYGKARERTRHWPEFLREVIRETGPAGIHTPPIRLLETVLPEDELPRGRVTLLGDAMHSTVPFRGMGANMGILGACLLGNSLLDGLQQGRSVDEILRVYERGWIPKGRQVVLDSRAAGEGDENEDLSGGRLEEQIKSVD